MSDYLDCRKIKEINTFLNSCLKEQCFECTVQFDSDFSFDFVNDVIHYSFIVCDLHDKLFEEVCKSCNPDIVNVDNFVLSFFHELGHFNTLHIFNEKEWKNYEKLNEVLNSKLKDNKDENLEKKLYKQYYTDPIELEATQWGCDYIVSHSDEVEKFFNRFQELYTEFLKDNNYEFDLC